MVLEDRYDGRSRATEGTRLAHVPGSDRPDRITQVAGIATKRTEQAFESAKGVAK